MSWPARKYPPVSIRLAEKTDRTPGLGPDGECWEFRGVILRSGYGQISRDGVTEYVHRVAYELHHKVDLGRARETNILVLHRCDNRKCVNPAHLFLGDDKTNFHDMVRKGRRVMGDQKGVKNPGSRLSEDEVRAIRAFKGSHGAAAEKFGISENWAWHIRSRNAWTHI